MERATTAGSGDRSRETGSSEKPSQRTGHRARSGSSDKPGKRARARAAATASLFAYDRGRGDVVVGADEAGRGCLAGPLVAAAVCIDHGKLSRRERLALSGLNDSKLVTVTERQRLYDSILRCASHTAIAVCDSATIDSVGLHRCNLRILRDAVVRACGGLGSEPAVRLVDGFALDDEDLEHEAIAKGDSTSAAIAAASILAKVTRDDIMRRADERHPGWGFADHVGYATEAHLSAISAMGPSPLHRMSFQCSAYPEASPRSESAGEMLVLDEFA